ncbi:MAG: hypothetical protein U0271_15340 [Polyangiaceae bacterium]
MNKRIVGVLLCVLGIVLLGAASASASWFSGSHGDFSVSAGPFFVERCYPEWCETEVLRENTKGDSERVWAIAGIGFSGCVSLLSIWYLVTIILGLVKSRGAQWLGWITLVFTAMTTLAGLVFIALKPPALREMGVDTGAAFMFLGSGAGIVGCVFSALGVPPKAGAPTVGGREAMQGTNPQALSQQGYPQTTL